MTIADDLGRKATKQSKKAINSIFVDFITKFEFWQIIHKVNFVSDLICLYLLHGNLHSRMTINPKWPLVWGLTHY